MKINVVSKKLIKPCIPTPQNLKNYKISFIDELSPPLPVTFLLFYPSKAKRTHLEESLAKILVEFYPLAGRYIKKDHLVDCSDQGAEFVVAEAVDVEFIHLIDEKKTDKITYLLPRQPEEINEATDPLLSIQITEFKCGGLAIGISVSHRIFDAASVVTFFAAWSNASNPGPGEKISPSFNSPSLFPGKNQGHNPDSDPSETGYHSVVVKKFSFNMEAILSLRSKLQPNDGNGVFSTSRMISRVRLVCALIAKALIGLDRAKHGKSRACLISQPVNMRGRTIPPLPKHSCGNLLIQSATRCMSETESKDMGIQELVYIPGDAIGKTIADCAEILSLRREEQNNIITKPVANVIENLVTGEVNVIWFSDWTKFGFYETDFGWGKPVWASVGTTPFENFTLLMENKDRDGIEAWVHLNQKDMLYFEQDEEIRFFTT